MIHFVLGLLTIISIDCLVGFFLFILWRFMDLKYFSTSEISLLKEENEYLKKENKKVRGSSSDFWKEGWFMLLFIESLLTILLILLFYLLICFIFKDIILFIKRKKDKTNDNHN